MTIHILRGSVRDAAGNTTSADVSVDVTAAQAGPRILFAAQWRDTGNTVSARRDRIRFDSGYNSGCNVVTAAETGIIGWPTANVLRVPAAVGDVAGANLRIVKSGMPPIHVGDRRYFRIYGAITMSPGSPSGAGTMRDSSAHPIESNNGAVEWANPITWWGNGSTDYPGPGWNWGFFASGNHYHEGGAQAIVRPRHQVLRFEWSLYRISQTHYTMQARLYDADGALLADEQSQRLQWGSGANANLATAVLAIRNTAEFDAPRILVGSNQGGWMPVGSNPQMYQAALAISDEGWLGPYNAATEANWDV